MTSTASWYHCSVKTMGRSAGRSVVAAAAYRLGARLHEECVDQTHDYQRRGGVLSAFTLAPADAPAWAHEPEALWNGANAAEKRVNSTLAREIELALPASVSFEVREGIARGMAQQLVERYGVAVSVGMHAPSSHGDQANFHAHILFTTRSIDAEGFGAKTRVLDDRKTGPGEVVFLRGHACELINQALEDAGSDERVDHRSFAERGIEREPDGHLGPAGSALARKHGRSDRADTNDEIATGNQHLNELVDELAALDAEIAAEQERELNARHGAPDERPGGTTGPAYQSPFQLVRRQLKKEGGRVRTSHDDPGLSMFLRKPEEPPAATIPAPVVEEPAAPVEEPRGGLFRRAPDTTPALGVTPPAVQEPAAPERMPPPSALEAKQVESASSPLEEAAHARQEKAEPPAVEPAAALPPPVPVSSPRELAMNAVHNQNVVQANADARSVENEEAGAPGSRMERLRSWWGNMRETFTDWRGQLQERYQAFRHPSTPEPTPQAPERDLGPDV